MGKSSPSGNPIGIGTRECDWQWGRMRIDCVCLGQRENQTRSEGVRLGLGSTLARGVRAAPGDTC